MLNPGSMKTRYKILNLGLGILAAAYLAACQTAPLNLVPQDQREEVQAAAQEAGENLLAAADEQTGFDVSGTAEELSGLSLNDVVDKCVESGMLTYEACVAAQEIVDKYQVPKQDFIDAFGALQGPVDTIESPVKTGKYGIADPASSVALDTMPVYEYLSHKRDSSYSWEPHDLGVTWILQKYVMSRFEQFDHNGENPVYGRAQFQGGNWSDVGNGTTEEALILDVYTYENLPSDVTQNGLHVGANGDAVMIDGLNAFKGSVYNSILWTDGPIDQN
jgi:hypothetical protein